MMQNAALRAVFGLGQRTPRVEMFTGVACGILPVRGMYEQSIHKFVFSAMNGTMDTNLNFDRALTQNARRNHHLYVPRVNQRYGEHAITYAGPRYYNMLPLATREAGNTMTFKAGCIDFYASRLDGWLS